MRGAHTAAMNMVADARLSAIGYRLFSHQSPCHPKCPARTRAGEVYEGRLRALPEAAQAAFGTRTEGFSPPAGGTAPGEFCGSAL